MQRRYSSHQLKINSVWLIDPKGKPKKIKYLKEIGEIDLRGTRTAEREEMRGLQRNIGDGCVHYFYSRILLVYTYVKISNCEL